MHLKIKAYLLSFMAAGALISGGTAVKTLSGTESTAPPEAAVRGEQSDAAYWLYDSGGYVAIYGGEREIELTDIETQTLNDYDRDLLREGIPVSDKTELLLLLEDLSS